MKKLFKHIMTFCQFCGYLAPLRGQCDTFSRLVVYQIFSARARIASVTDAMRILSLSAIALVWAWP